ELAEVSPAQESASAMRIQCSLTVGSPDDPMEDEADQMADRVMRMTEPGFVQRKCSHCEDEEVLRKPIHPIIQRASPEAGSKVDKSTASAIESSRGGGASLPSPARSFMESRFGTDFSAVRVHTGSEAAQLSSDLNAQAFTVGSDVF